MPPAQNPTTSNQVVCTPREFLRAIERKWGRIDFDLAGTRENFVAPQGFTKEQNSLVQDWVSVPGVKFCNPPFADICGWSGKAFQWALSPERSGTLLLLGPAAIETQWFRFNVWPIARVHVLVPRIKFIGHTNVFPKGLMLAEYGQPSELKFWDWKGRKASRRKLKKA